MCEKDTLLPINVNEFCDKKREPVVPIIQRTRDFKHYQEECAIFTRLRQSELED